MEIILPRHKILISDCAQISNDVYSETFTEKYKDVVKVFDEATDCQCFIFRKDNDIIITGQGTTTFTDFCIDLQIWRVKSEHLKDTMVHAGFDKVYKSIRDKLHEEIEKLKNLECNRIVCTGHSLFGAISTIAAADIALNFDIPVVCITFGSPRVGASDFVSLFNKVVEKSYRCIYGDDSITYSPLPFRFKHVNGKVQYKMSYGIPRTLHHSMNKYIKATNTPLDKLNKYLVNKNEPLVDLKKPEDIADFLLDRLK